MPSADSNPVSNRRRTRRGLLTSGAAFLGAFAGCSSHVGVLRNDAESGATPRAPKDDGARAGPLTVGTTGALTGAVNWGVGLWNANPSPSGDRLVWTQLGHRPTFDERLADHFAARAEVSSSGGRSAPPFRVVTALSNQAGTAEAFVDGAVDVAGLGGSRSEDNPTEYVGDRADAVVRHSVARDGWVFIVSPALAEAGVDSLTPDEIRQLYSGEITTWRALGGPDVEPFLFLGPAVTSSSNTAYEDFFFTGNTTPSALDYRAGQPTQLVSAAADRDNALGVVQAPGVRIAREQGVPTLDVIVDSERVSVYDQGYPMTDEVYLYTRGEPAPRERAFLELLSSPFGQRELVGRDLLPVEPLAGW